MASKTPQEVLNAEQRRRTRRRGKLAELETLLGPPALLPGEDPTAYWDLVERIRSAESPCDVIDELFVRDQADLEWEILRLRRSKANIQREAFRKAAINRVWSHDRDLANRLERLGRGFEVEFGRVCQKLDLSLDRIHAEAFSACLEEVERVDALIRSLEARRLVGLKEADRRRDRRTLQRREERTLALAAPHISLDRVHDEGGE